MPTGTKKRAPRRRTRLAASSRRELIEQAATELFATRGFRGAAVEEIARRAGVTPPVVYDHFASKRALFRHLVDHHYAQLRAVWIESAASDRPLGERLPDAIDAWYRYLEEHPFAPGLLFREPADDPRAGASHRKIREESRAAMVVLLRQEATSGGADLDDLDLELTWETLRAVLQGLALWWTEHPEVPRARVVTAAMNVLWLGYDRVFSGERWTASFSEPASRSIS